MDFEHTKIYQYKIRVAEAIEQNGRRLAGHFAISMHFRLEITIICWKRDGYRETGHEAVH